MNMKKLALVGVLTLVVIGCVLAAGCTSTSTETTTSDDQIIGTWMNNNGSSAFIIDSNLTGAYYTFKDDAVDEKTSILWKKNDDGTYALINGNAKATVTLDAVKGQFTTDSGSVFIKQVSDASGLVSKANGKYYNNGKEVSEKEYLRILNTSYSGATDNNTLPDTGSTKIIPKKSGNTTQS